MGIDSNTFCFSEIKIVHTLLEVTYALGPMTLDFMKFNKIIHVYKSANTLIEGLPIRLWTITIQMFLTTIRYQSDSDEQQQYRCSWLQSDIIRLRWTITIQMFQTTIRYQSLFYLHQFIASLVLLYLYCRYWFWAFKWVFFLQYKQHCNGIIMISTGI